MSSPEMSERGSFQKWSRNACPAAIFIPLDTWGWPLDSFGGGSVIGVNRGIVTALRHSFYVQAANSHKVTSQWFWEIISWADNGQPHSPYPTASAPTTAVLVNFYGLGSPPQGGSRLQEPHLPCLLGALVLNPKHEWTWMSANFII